MKLDFNFNLKDLSGEEIQDANAGKLLAQSLINQTKGDAIKYWEWALAINKGEVIDLDTSDQGVIKSFIKDNESLTILAKSQLLLVFKKD